MSEGKEPFASGIQGDRGEFSEDRPIEDIAREAKAEHYKSKLAKRYPDLDSEKMKHIRRSTDRMLGEPEDD